MTAEQGKQLELLLSSFENQKDLLIDGRFLKIKKAIINTWAECNSNEFKEEKALVLCVLCNALYLGERTSLAFAILNGYSVVVNNQFIQPNVPNFFYSNNIHFEEQSKERFIKMAYLPSVTLIKQQGVWDLSTKRLFCKKLKIASEFNNVVAIAFYLEEIENSELAFCKNALMCFYPIKE